MLLARSTCLCALGAHDCGALRRRLRRLRIPALSLTTLTSLRSTRASRRVLVTASARGADGAAQEYDAQRETVIKRSRDMQKAAKTAIYCLHRADDAGAGKDLATVEKVAEELRPLLTAEPTLRHGGFSNAIEEYAEAAIFRYYLAHGSLMPYSLLPLATREEYLGGLLDFTGELNRYAVLRATARDVASVTRARDVVDVIFGQMLQFDLRNGSARKKFDTLKYTLKKLESLLYELQLSSAIQSTRGDEPEPVAAPAAEADEV